jgi:hypothetical protein
MQVAEHIRVLGCDKRLRRRLKTPESEEVFAPVAEKPASKSADSGGFGGPIPSREELIGLLKNHHGIVLRVAKDLGCSRRQVGRMLDHYQIDLNLFRTRHG